MGDRAVPFAIFGYVRIHQIKWYAPDAYFPDMCIDDPFGIRHLEHHRLAIVHHHLCEWQCREVLGFVVGNLLTVHRQALGEIAVTVQKPDGCQINVAVTGFFQVVACQHAQSARIDFQYVR